MDRGYYILFNFTFSGLLDENTHFSRISGLGFKITVSVRQSDDAAADDGNDGPWSVVGETEIRVG